MPDTPTPIVIYQETLLEAAKENRQLKAHLDALTAALPEMIAVAISGLPNGGGVSYNEALEIGRKVVRLAEEPRDA